MVKNTPPKPETATILLTIPGVILYILFKQTPKNLL